MYVLLEKSGMNIILKNQSDIAVFLEAEYEIVATSKKKSELLVLV